MEDNTKLSLIFNKDYQAKILNFVFDNHLFGKRCCLHLHPSYFENHYFGWVFDKLQKHHQKYNEIPSKSAVVNHLKSIKEEEKPNYKKALKQILESKMTDEGFVKDTLTEFIQASEFKKLHKKIGDLYNEGKYQEAYGYTQEKINEIKQIRFSDDTYVREEDIFPILESNRTMFEEKIVTGIGPIDEFLGGGIDKGTTTTLIGGYNVGKTITSIDIACENMERGKRVLFIYHEGTKNEIVTKFISRLTAIPANLLFAYSDEITQDDKERIGTAKKLIGKFSWQHHRF